MTKTISDESLRLVLAHLAPNQAKLCSEAERAVRAVQLGQEYGLDEYSTLSENTRPVFWTSIPASRCSTATRQVPRSGTARRR